MKQIKPPYSKLILNVSNQELRQVLTQHRENFGNSDFLKQDISVLLYDWHSVITDIYIAKL